MLLYIFIYFYNAEIYEIIKTNYPEFGTRILWFGDAHDIDQKIFGKGGGYWRAAYNLPKELDYVEFNGNITNNIAKNVGIFTFDY